MDNDQAHTFRPTAEEMAWDEEFKSDNTTQPGGNLTSDLVSAATFVARLPGAILSSIVPEETTQHGRAAVREGFLALRSLLAAVGDRIEEMLAEPEGTTVNETIVQGPPGTWGSGRTANPPIAPALRPLSSSKVKRIDVSETAPEPAAESGDMP